VKLPFDNLMKPQEWLGLITGLLATGAIYAFLIHPSVQLFAQQDEAFEARALAERELEKSRDEYQRVQETITASLKRLRALGGTPPPASEKDLQISRVTSLAKECAVTIDQYLPIETVDHEDHQSNLLQFTGRGSYASIQRYFQRFESDLDFVDITNFSITTTGKQPGSQCVVSWSCRINGMLTPGGGRKPAGLPATPVAEVARREP
jgi:hypothetical protein